MRFAAETYPRSVNPHTPIGSAMGTSYSILIRVSLAASEFMSGVTNG